VSAAGFQVLVLCAQEHQPSGSRFPGVHVVHAPFDDWEPSSSEWRIARRAGTVVAQALRGGQRVLVTCAMGRNRSGLVVALALIESTGAAPELVIGKIARLREGALSNPHFVRALRALRKLGRAGSEEYA